MVPVGDGILYQWWLVVGGQPGHVETGRDGTQSGAVAPLVPELGLTVFLTYVLFATLAAGVLMAKRDV